MDANGCARAMARTRWMNVGGGETGDDGDAEVAIGDLSNPSRARALGTAADARAWGGVWMRVGSNARGSGRVWWCGVRRA